MCTLYENIKKLCDSKGITGSKMCADLGISRSILTGLKNGTKKSVSSETLQRFADYLGVSADRLLGLENKIKPIPKDELTETQKKAWALIQKMDDDTLRRFIAAAEAMLGV